MGSFFSRQARYRDEEIQVNISRFPRPPDTESRMGFSPNQRMVYSRSFPPTVMESTGSNFSPQSNVEWLPSPSQAYRREFNNPGQMMNVIQSPGSISSSSAQRNERESSSVFSYMTNLFKSPFSFLSKRGEQVQEPDISNINKGSMFENSALQISTSQYMRNIPTTTDFTSFSGTIEASAIRASIENAFASGRTTEKLSSDMNYPVSESDLEGENDTEQLLEKPDEEKLKNSEEDSNLKNGTSVQSSKKYESKKYRKGKDTSPVGSEDFDNRKKTQSSRKRSPEKIDDVIMKSRFLRSDRGKMPLVQSKSLKLPSIRDSKESEAEASKKSFAKMKKFRFSHPRTSFTGRKRKTYEGTYGNATTGVKNPRRQ